MNETATGHATAGSTHGDEDVSAIQNLVVALVLLVGTGMEVGVYYADLADKVTVAALLGLASIKFSVVAAYFMHLKFDAKLLRQFFITGVLLANFVYFIALTTLDLLFG